MKKKNLIFLVTLMIAAAFAFNASLALAKDMAAKDLENEAKKNIVIVSVSDAKAMFDKGGVVFIDVRERKEFKSGHIPGAMHLSRGMLELKIDKKVPDKNGSIVIYCKSGGLRACLSTYNLVRMGYKNVKNMAGGWKAWSKAGYPVE